MARQDPGNFLTKWGPAEDYSKSGVGAEIGKVMWFQGKLKEFMLNFLSGTDYDSSAERMRAEAWGAWTVTTVGAGKGAS